MDEKKKRLIFLGITGFLVLAIAMTVFYVRTKTPTSDSANGGTSVVDKTSAEGKIIIKDINDGEQEIPEYNVPLSTYNIEKFTEEDGIISYNGETHTGITVSEQQGTIDWQQVKAAGVEFAFIRVGFRGDTDGKIYFDNNFADNMQGATDAGVKIGVYFYSKAISEVEADAEADAVLEKIYLYQVTYPVAFVWEFSTGSSSEESRIQGLTSSDVTRFASTFCAKIEKSKYKAMFKADKKMGYEYFNLETLKDYDLWYVEYKKQPAFHYNYTIWQYTSEATVPGIDTAVKMSYSFTAYDGS